MTKRDKAKNCYYFHDEAGDVRCKTGISLKYTAQYLPQLNDMSDCLAKTRKN